MHQEPYDFYLLYFAAYLLNVLIFQIISKRIENFLLISKELAYNPIKEDTQNPKTVTASLNFTMRYHYRGQVS